MAEVSSAPYPRAMTGSHSRRFGVGIGVADAVGVRVGVGAADTVDVAVGVLDEAGSSDALNINP